MPNQHEISQLIADRPDCTVRCIHVSSMDNAVYLITAKSSGAQLLIDAADDAHEIEHLLREGGADADGGAHLRYLVTTHAHWDHTRATAEVARHTGAETVIGRDDAAQLFDERGVRATHEVVDGDALTLDGFSVELIGLRGHTAGSIALALAASESAGPALLFTGDSLFPGGVGNTGHSAERFASLIGDVEQKIFERFPDDTRVLPGHGAETTLGAERPSLADWKARGW